MHAWQRTEAGLLRPLLLLDGLQRLQPGPLELVALVPARHVWSTRHMGSQEEEQAHIFLGARQVPVRLQLVGGLVVVLRYPQLALLPAPPLRPADEVDTTAEVRRGNTHPGEVELVRAVEGAA